MINVFQPNRTASVILTMALFLMAASCRGGGDFVPTRPVNVELDEQGDTEEWTVVVTLNEGLLDGLVRSTLSVYLNGGDSRRSSVEIRPGPPIEDGEALVHPSEPKQSRVEWRFDMPPECEAGCTMEIPIFFTQLEESRNTSISPHVQLNLEWEHWEKMNQTLGSEPLHKQADVELIGPEGEDQ